MRGLSMHRTTVTTICNLLFLRFLRNFVYAEKDSWYCCTLWSPDYKRHDGTGGCAGGGTYSFWRDASDRNCEPGFCDEFAEGPISAAHYLRLQHGSARWCPDALGIDSVWHAAEGTRYGSRPYSGACEAVGRARLRYLSAWI